MALADIRHEVVLALAQTHEAQREARDVLAHGEDDEKVIAAGELEHLVRRETMLTRRLAEVDRRMADRYNPLGWVRQTWFGLMLHLESWIAHG
ncbi:MAG TPA: hypothetical protein VMU37_06020 [Caulobacteraceae bacterium]|nr:hypothetical protein [Caulobacteraceae bacterium]